MPTKSEEIEKIKAALSPEQQAELLDDGKGGWQQPVPFAEAERPPFPVDCLPSVVRDYVQQVAQSIQVPEDMAAVAALCALAVCCQGKYIIQGKPGYFEPLNIYGVVIAKPGERKSQTLRQMTRPLLEWEKEQNEQLTQSVATSRSQKNILEKQLCTAEKRAAEHPDDQNAYSAAQDLAIQLAEYKEIHPIRLMADDTTQEALATLMYRNHGAMSVLSAEGGIFDMMSGKYKSVSDIDLFLKAHAGDNVAIDRKGRATEYIENPALTMLLFAQPDVLSGLMGNAEFRGKGLNGRFLYCVPPSMMGRRDFDTQPIDAAVQAEYDALIYALLDVPYPQKPNVLTLGNEAHGVLTALFYHIEKQLNEELENMSDWAGKLTGAALRIAGLLHVAQHKENAIQLAVNADTMIHAVQIARYFLEHAKKAYGMMGADKAEADAKYILQKLEKVCGLKVTRSELIRACRGRFENADAMNQAIKELAERGYIREVETDVGYNNRKQVVYFINPYLTGIDGKDGKDGL